MIKKIVVLCSIAQTMVAFQLADFDVAMQTQRYASIIERSKTNQQLYAFFKHFYIRQQQAQLQSTELRIPTIMHHVWFGKPLSDAFKKLRQTWIDRHNDWTFILWTDKAENDPTAIVVHSFTELDEQLKRGVAKKIVVICDALQFDNKIHFDHAKNYGERSDILKWEIVYRYGGVYVDTDCQCYKPLTELHSLFDFYTGLQPLDTGLVQLGAALFAARPHHPLLERCVKEITPGEGPIVMRTGPIHFTNVCLKYLAQAAGRNIILPSDYFYPCGYEEREMHPSQWQKPISYAVHHWAGSWLTADAFTRSP